MLCIFFNIVVNCGISCCYSSGAFAANERDKGSLSWLLQPRLIGGDKKPLPPIPSVVSEDHLGALWWLHPISSFNLGFSHLFLSSSTTASFYQEASRLCPTSQSLMSSALFYLGGFFLMFRQNFFFFWLCWNPFFVLNVSLFGLGLFLFFSLFTWLLPLLQKNLLGRLFN